MKLIYYQLLLLLSLPLAVQAQKLETLQTMALENNPNLKAQYKKVEFLLQKVDRVSALKDPNLSFGYFINPIQTRVGPQQAKISLSQMFPWFGTRSLQAKSASVAAEAAYQEFVDAQNKLCLELAIVYYSYFELKRRNSILLEQIDLLEQIKSIAEEQYSAANISLADVIRIDIRIDDLKTDLEINNQEGISKLALLNELIYRPLEEAVEIDFDWEKVKVDDLNLSDSSWYSHPNFRAQQLMVKSMELSESAAKKKALPQIGLGIDYVFVGSRDGLQNSSENGNDAIMPMISLSLPIFRKGYKAQIKEQKIMQEYYLQKQEASKKALQSSFVQSASEMQQKYAQVELYQNQLLKTEQIIRIYRTAYANAEIGIQELLSTHAQYLKYKVKLISAQANYASAKARHKYIINDNTAQPQNLNNER